MREIQVAMLTPNKKKRKVVARRAEELGVEFKVDGEGDQDFDELAREARGLIAPLFHSLGGGWCEERVSGAELEVGHLAVAIEHGVEADGALETGLAGEGRASRIRRRKLVRGVRAESGLEDKGDLDGSEDFDGCAVRERGFVGPLADGLGGGLDEERMSGDEAQVADSAVAIDEGFKANRALDAGLAGERRIDRFGSRAAADPGEADGRGRGK
jgi:hypothetical protein